MDVRDGEARVGTAIVFPGQGSQRPGMALDFAARFPSAARVLALASHTLDLNVEAEIASGERLFLTEITQPCLLAAEVAMWTALRDELGVAADRFGGHSLGEYSALVAASALELQAALRLVRLRGRLMQEAVPAGLGGMCAVIADARDLDRAATLAAEAGVDVANHNSPTQIVLSGMAPALGRAREALAALDVRIVELQVSAPFHSRHMAPIAERFRQALGREAPAFNAERAARVTSNAGGGFHGRDLSALLDALALQLVAPVRWVDNMRALLEGGRRVIEVGPNRPLSRFLKEVGGEPVSVTHARGLDRLALEAAA